MRFLVLAILLALLAFFAAGELALIRLRPSRVQQLEEAEEPGARSVARLQHRLRSVLVATQLGLVLALLAMGWLARGLAEQVAGWMGSGEQAWIDAGVFLVLALLATLLGGLVPKAWVLHRREG